MKCRSTCRCAGLPTAERQHAVRQLAVQSHGVRVHAVGVCRPSHCRRACCSTASSSSLWQVFQQEQGDLGGLPVPQWLRADQYVFEPIHSVCLPSAVALGEELGQLSRCGAGPTVPRTPLPARGPSATETWAVVGVCCGGALQWAACFAQPRARGEGAPRPPLLGAAPPLGSRCTNARRLSIKFRSVGVARQ